MAFELPPLPWAEDALEPVTSARTISFHYGKHHRAYVDNLNKLVAGTELDGRGLEEVIAAVAGDPGQGGCLQQRRPGLEPQLLLAVDEAGRRRRAERRAGRQDRCHLRRAAAFVEQFKAAAVGRFGSGWAWLVDDAGALKIVTTRQRRDAGCRRSSRCSPATSGSTPTTSTSRTVAPTSSRPSGTAWSTGTSRPATSPPSCTAAPWAQGWAAGRKAPRPPLSPTSVSGSRQGKLTETGA